jgi:hypothetical protein
VWDLKIMRPGPFTKSEKERIAEIEEWKKRHPGRSPPVFLRGCCNGTTGVSGNLTLGPLMRKCPCGKEFYFVQGPFRNEKGLIITPYRNQKICPECKEKEREKPLPRICTVCGILFAPKRRNDAKTCSPTCRKKRSDQRNKGI